MRTPAPNQTRPPPASPGTTRRRRSLAPLIAAALTLAAVSTGVAVALSVGQTPARSTGQPAGVAVSPTTVSPTQAATPPSGAAQPSDQGEATPGPAATSPHSPALADGTYDAFVRGVNVDRRTVVIDLAQVIEGEAAIKKALREDGKPEGWASAGYYVRNQNSLLRTPQCGTVSCGPWKSGRSSRRADARCGRYVLGLSAAGRAEPGPPHDRSPRRRAYRTPSCQRPPPKARPRMTPSRRKPIRSSARCSTRFSTLVMACSRLASVVANR